MRLSSVGEAGTNFIASSFLAFKNKKENERNNNKNKSRKGSLVHKRNKVNGRGRGESFHLNRGVARAHTTSNNALEFIAHTSAQNLLEFQAN